MRNVLIFVVIIFLFACAPKQKISLLKKGATLAIAGFSRPRHSWEMLAGYIYETKEIPPEVFQKLNMFLLQVFKQKHLTFVGPKGVRQCEELVIGNNHRSDMSAFNYWLEVGKCIPVDFIIVPFVFKWQEREGGEWGVESPAAVVMDFYLLDVNNKQVQRFHFEEEQLSLSENLLDIDKFFKRRGRWVTASELAREGIKEFCEELGL